MNERKRTQSYGYELAYIITWTGLAERLEENDCCNRTRGSGRVVGIKRYVKEQGVKIVLKIDEKVFCKNTFPRGLKG